MADETLTPRSLGGLTVSKAQERSEFLNMMIYGPSGWGKAQPKSSLILTPYGWVKNGDLKVGDEVTGSDGYPCNVIGVYDKGILDTYTVTFNDGAQIVCCGDHLWKVQDRSKANRNNWYVISTKKLMHKGIKSGGGYRFKIQLVEPVQHPFKELPIEPYLMGVLLANGYLEKSIISTND